MPESDLTHHIADLSRLAICLTRDRVAAEDLAQEALVRVWARLSEGHAIDDLRPYLMAAARNLARRPMRRHDPLETTPELGAPPDVGSRLALRDAATALARLPRDEARLILAVAAQGLSYAEAARAEGLPLGTVTSRIARGRARLRQGCGLAVGESVETLLGVHAA